MLFSFPFPGNATQTQLWIFGSGKTNEESKADKGAQIGSYFSLLIKEFPAMGTKLYLIALELQPLSVGSLTWSCPQARGNKIQSHFFGHVIVKT